MMDLQKQDQFIDALCNWIEECRALNLLSPGYINDTSDVDREGCFV